MRASAWAVISAGSSPLARGLHGVGRELDLLARIIPARAGFTKTYRTSRTEGGDHPRSRGVYSVRSTMQGPRRGSSPLARGLRRVLRYDEALRGIIPARAGFTRQSPGHHARSRDHPRSRGVYASSGIPYSSAQRIIPARAGFTRAGRPPARSRPDHPRSRGVYPGMRVMAAEEMGSSPLARGLRPVVTHIHDEVGIIPARAGFTGARPPPTPPTTDHPRSRGVYSSSRST